MKEAYCIIGCNDHFPYELTCPRCGAEVNIFDPRGNEACCRLCGYSLFEHEKFTN